MLGKTSAASGEKRKRASAAKEPPKKRARSESDDESEDNDGADEILRLQESILESKKNYNNIPKLIETAQSHDDDSDLAALASVALTKVFMNLLASGALLKKKGQPEKEAIVAQWLKDRYFEYKGVLLDFIKEDELALPALAIAMKLVKTEAQYLVEFEEHSFPHIWLQQIMQALLNSSSDEARSEFVDNFLVEYEDIRFYALKSIKTIAEKSESAGEEDAFEDAFELLSAIGEVPKELENYYLEKPKKKSSPLNSLHQHQRQGQDAWLAVLKLASTKEQRKRILDIMSTVIAPWFTRPELLADFLTDSYNAGGSMSLLALSGVFWLIKERNLDYPSFYTKLYSLLDREILHSKHRSRFFRLMDTFLTSSHLPAALVASFVKKLARLALSAPPAAIVFIVPWTYNILRRHPTCTFMIHRETRDAEVKSLIESEGMDDPFLANEIDPMETNAIDSCLWELVQLQGHYHPNVATIAKIISEQFTKQSYNVEDFLDHSYSSLLEAEMSKEVKKPPVTEFHIPKRVFFSQDTGVEAEDSLVVKLFDFQ